MKIIYIKGYKYLYSINRKGEIYSYHSNKLMKLMKDKDGYLKVNLSKNGKSRKYIVHRLVAQTFLENPNKFPQVNHKNGIKDDNRVENLEWCTVSSNHKHAFKIGLKNHKGSKHPNSKLTEKEVLNIRRYYKIKNITQQELANKYNVDRKTIGRIINRVTWRHV